MWSTFDFQIDGAGLDAISTKIPASWTVGIKLCKIK
jgi:hypothetical protein